MTIKKSSPKQKPVKKDMLALSEKEIDLQRNRVNDDDDLFKSFNTGPQ